MKIDGYTRMAAVVANPIKHSLSPFIHNLAFDLTDENGVYLAWEVESKKLAAIVENVRNLDMYGLNISMPYKGEIIKFMDELSPAAELIGAVNTVVNHSGKLIGHNTDGIGFFNSLKKYDFKIENKQILVLGGGGAAIALIAQAALSGAKKIVVAARKSASYDPLNEKLAKLSSKTGVEILLTDLSGADRLQKELNQTDLLVNATSVGMDGASFPLEKSLILPDKLLVVDAIYKVRETPFLRWAKEQGAQTENGLGMLIGQAAESFYLWTGKEMPVDKITLEMEREV
ncbi:shikimate dehydrogenase [Lactococcus cremoris]|uniref:shikimate dehydrogenase n=1 Tax=Lactococcus lactis subsp. cremoris TaxID=1359 RepID=UPI001E5EBD81|nr:shikimate dehydrogenase [Lactococcus cremoris]MCD6632241.1 shikimate dehydrogenase [Lactococcus cremoris]